MSRITAPRGSFGYAQDRLFDSAPSAVPCDKSVRRFAQDDDFVGGLKKNTPNRLTLVGLRPGQARLKAVPFVRRLSHPQGSVRASCAFPNGQLTNLPWASLNSVAIAIGGWLSLLRGLSKLVRQQGKQETVDKVPIGKYRRTQYAFLNKAKSTVKANRGVVGDIDLEEDSMQSQSAKGKPQQQPGGLLSKAFATR